MQIYLVFTTKDLLKHGYFISNYHFIVFDHFTGQKQ